MSDQANKFNISYYPRLFMKAQVLANFLIEYTWSDDKPEEASIEQPAKQPDPLATWILLIDRASNFQGVELN